MSERKRRRTRSRNSDLKSFRQSKQASPRKGQKLSAKKDRKITLKKEQKSSPEKGRKTCTEKHPESTPALRPVLEKFARFVADGYKHVRAAIACGRATGSASYLYRQPGVQERIAELRVIKKKANDAEFAAEAALKAQISTDLSEEEIKQHLAAILRDPREQTRDRIRASAEVRKYLKTSGHGSSAQRDQTPSSGEEEFVREAMADPYTWVTNHTRTYNEHWVKEGRPRPDEPFPNEHYLLDVFVIMELNSVWWWEKSRDMMLTWACVAFLTFKAMKTPYYGVLFQTQKDDKVIQLVDYAKHLWRNSDERIRRAFPLAKDLGRQSDHRLDLANGSSIIGIPGGAHQIRSYHPAAYLNDESSFQPDAGECYNEAIAAVADKIIFNSSAGPGWYADARKDIVRNETH